MPPAKNKVKKLLKKPTSGSIDTTVVIKSITNDMPTHTPQRRVNSPQACPIQAAPADAAKRRDSRKSLGEPSLSGTKSGTLSP